MDKLRNVLTQVRPIKLCFVIDVGDFSTFYSSVQFLTNALGGIYMPILEADEMLWSPVTKRFISANDPDVILNFSTENPTKIQDWFDIQCFNRPDFDLMRRELRTPLMILDEIRSPFFELPTGPVLYCDETAAPDPFLAVHLGISTQDEVQALRHSAFGNLNFIAVRTLEEAVALIEQHVTTILHLTRGFSMSSETSSSIWAIDDNPNDLFTQSTPTIILGSNQSLASMLYFWNIRATFPGARIRWVPKESFGGYDLALSWTTYSNVIVPHGVVRLAEISTQLAHAKTFETTRLYFNVGANRWQSYEAFSLGHIEGGVLSVVHPPDKLISKQGWNLNLALEIRTIEEFFVPKSPSLGNRLVDRTPNDVNQLGFSRIGQSKFVTTARHLTPFRETPLIESVRLPKDNEVFEAIVDERGFSITPTIQGDLLERSFDFLGGAPGLDILARARVVDLLVKLSPTRTEKIIKELRTIAQVASQPDIEKRIREVLGGAQGVAEVPTESVSGMESMLSIPKSETTEFRSILEHLQEVGVLLRGKSVKCDACHQAVWLSFDKPIMPTKCPGCGNSMSMPIGTPEADDKFRINHMWARAVDQGIIPVLLAMRMCLRQKFFGARFMGARNVISKSSDFKCEVDLFLSLGGRFGLCEIKADRDFETEQTKRLLLLAERLRVDFVLLASLKKDVSDVLSSIKVGGTYPLVLVAGRDVLFAQRPPSIAKYFEFDRGKDVFSRNPVGIEP